MSGTERVGARGARVALLSEVLLTGAVLAVVSIPVVTAVPALAAGAEHLRRHVDHRGDSLGDLVRGVARAVRELWPLGLGVPAVLAVVGLDLWLVRTGALPGGTVVGVVTGVLAVALVIVVLRFVGAWRPGTAVREGLRGAAWRSVEDLPGSALLLAGAGVVAVVVWMLLPLLLVAPGLLALAALAVEHRRAAG